MELLSGAKLALNARVANLSSPKMPDLVPKKPTNRYSSLKTYTHKTCINKHKIDTTVMLVRNIV